MGINDFIEQRATAVYQHQRDDALRTAERQVAEWNQQCVYRGMSSSSLRLTKHIEFLIEGFGACLRAYTATYIEACKQASIVVDEDCASRIRHGIRIVVERESARLRNRIEQAAQGQNVAPFIDHLNAELDRITVIADRDVENTLADTSVM